MRHLKQLLISQDKSLIDVASLHEFLSKESTWAKGISYDTVVRSIENSLCFGAFLNDQQVGLCRVITDYATFADLVDVIVWPDFRGHGISKRLLEAVVNHEQLANLRRFTLATSSAHALYKKFGFSSLKNPGSFMEIYRADIYSKTLIIS